MHTREPECIHGPAHAAPRHREPPGSPAKRIAGSHGRREREGDARHARRTGIGSARDARDAVPRGRGEPRHPVAQGRRRRPGRGRVRPGRHVRNRSGHRPQPAARGFRGRPPRRSVAGGRRHVPDMAGRPRRARGRRRAHPGRTRPQDGDRGLQDQRIRPAAPWARGPRQHDAAHRPRPGPRARRHHRDLYDAMAIRIPENGPTVRQAGTSDPVRRA